MRSLLIVIVSFLGGGLILAQSPNKSVKIEALRALIGNEVQSAGVSFLGDEIRPYLNGSKKGFKSWGKLNRNTDVFVVFSEETKALVRKKSKKNVVVGDSIGAFFTRTWRGQDFCTRIDLQGDEVAFLETSPKPVDPKVKWVQGASDSLIAEFVTDLTEKKGKVEVLLVGTKVNQAYLDTTDLSDDFNKLDRILSYVIVPSEEMKEAFSKITSKEVYVKMSEPDPGKETGLMDRMKWMIVEAKGSNLGRIRGSGNLKSIIKPR